MAAFVAAQLDGYTSKVFTVTFNDNEAAVDLAVDFTTNGMTDLYEAPLKYWFVRTTSPDTNNSEFAITAAAATGITIRKLSAAGGANAIVLRVYVETPHSIVQ